MRTFGSPQKQLPCLPTATAAAYSQQHYDGQLATLPFLCAQISLPDVNSLQAGVLKIFALGC